MRVGVLCPYSLSIPGGVQGQVLGLARVLRRPGDWPAHAVQSAADSSRTSTPPSAAVSASSMSRVACP